MCGSLLLFKSLTHAQRVSKYLEKNGISTFIGRAPREINETSCGYFVKVQDYYLNRSLELLRQMDIAKFKVYICLTDGTYKERSE